MANYGRICIYKWKIKLDDFGFGFHSLTELIEVLRKCGMEINTLDNTVIFRLIVMVSADPHDTLGEAIRNSIADELTNLSRNVDPQSTIKKLFNTFINHIRLNEPIDVVLKDHSYEGIMEGDHFEIELRKEFMNNIRTLVENSLGMPNPDSIQSVIDKWTEYISGGKNSPIPTADKDPNKSFSYKLKFNPDPKVSDQLKNIKSVEKIVRYKNHDWKVNYSISMAADETYTHKIEVWDYNDHDNKISTIIKTDSHFIKALDERLKKVIDELEENLWTIDRFEKWSGDLGD